MAFTKCALFGLAIVAISAGAWLTVAGRTSAVGSATTRRVVASIGAVLVIDLVFGGAALALDV